MATSANAKSKVLSDDALIYRLSESMNAAQCYSSLGLSLLGSAAEVSNIIGQTSVDYNEVVFQCLLKWRNANGSREGNRLLAIFRNLKLRAAASFLEKELAKYPSCLGNDVFLQSLAGEIDSVTYYRELGIKLVGSEAQLENIVGIPNPQYKDSLFKVLVRFRDREGASFETLKKLRKILIKHKQKQAVEVLAGLEPEIMTDEEIMMPSEEHEEVSNSLSSSGNSDDIMPLRSQVSTQTSIPQESSPPESSSTSSSERFYDIYLVYSRETDHVKRVKGILKKYRFTVMTADDIKLGLPVLESIESALEVCSHVVVIVSKEDSDLETDAMHSMTIEMAFQTRSQNAFYGRILPIICCKDSEVLPRYRSLTFSRINDGNLETRLADSIDRNLRIDREKTLSSPSSDTDRCSTNCNGSGDATPKSLKSTVP